MASIINQSLFAFIQPPQQYSIILNTQQQNYKPLIQSQCNNFLRMLQSSVLQLYQFHQIKTIRTNYLEIILLTTFRQKCGIKSKIQINFQLKTITIHFMFLEAGHFIHISNSFHKKMVFTFLNKINLFNTFQNLNFYLQSNGLLESRTYNTFLNRHTSSFILNKHVIRYIQQTERLMMDQVNCILDMIDAKCLWNKTQNNSKQIEMMQFKSKIVMEIQDLIGVAHIKLHEFPSNEQEKKVKSKLTIQYINNRTNLLSSSKALNLINKQCNLYSLRLDQPYYLQNKLTVDRVENQLVKIYQPLLNRFQSSHLADGQNLYAYNTVTIKNEKDVETKKSHYEGGFSRFELAQIDMANSESVNPVLSPNQKVQKGKLRQESSVNDNSKRLKYLHKMIAIKMPKDANDYQKIKHEKLIVRNFRNIVSPYFIKYYNATQPNFQYRHYLLMDYFGDLPNLATYFEQNQQSTSLSTKLKIILHLARALTILQSTSVVHMDFTPHNIFINTDMVPKIIDFGQAYHPSLQTQKNVNYLPGYTLPYCPPQTFNKKKIFETRSDIFSLGVIIFKLLFNKFPSYNTKQLQKSYINGNYMQKFYLSPQGLIDIYNNKISSLLLQLIMHCMREQCQSRPYPFWIYVTLIKLCMLIS